MTCIYRGYSLFGISSPAELGILCNHMPVSDKTARTFCFIFVGNLPTSLPAQGMGTWWYMRPAFLAHDMSTSMHMAQNFRGQIFLWISQNFVTKMSLQHSLSTGLGSSKIMKWRWITKIGLNLENFDHGSLELYGTYTRSYDLCFTWIVYHKISTV